ncbi:MAG TPA: class I SAM-dependent methyltransferase [Candidatus Dormibacteraeota bacterium]|nr:class I SAM-dependent methyltransferase [Candidatus Dormibacteraeota bacterium]
MDATFYDKRVSEKVPTSDNPEMISLVDRIERWCRVTEGSRVLDFGCYDGYVLRKLLSRKRIRGIGLDISPAAVRLAQRLGNGQALEFVVSDGLPIPFPTASFDVVICSEILEHVADFGRIVGEISRVLAPGGRLYATMPNSLKDVWGPLQPLCRRVDEVEGHVRRMTLKEFVGAVTSNGYVVARAQYRGFILSAIWYRNVIYRPRVKEAGGRLLSGKESFIRDLATNTAHTAMHLYMAGDRPFARYRGCMSIDAAFIRAATQSVA